MSIRKAFLILPTLLLLSLAVVFLLLEGCRDGAKSRVTATISAEKGGSITSADGRLTLEIPPNALAKDTEIGVQTVSVDQLPAPLRDLAGSSAYRLEPEGLEFSSPVTVRLKLAPQEGQPPEGVVARLLVTQGATGEPEFLDEVETRINLADGSVVVSGEVRHFSWLVKKDDDLEVKMEKVEPREQPVGSWFEVVAQVSALEPKGFPERTVQFTQLHAALSASGSVELMAINIGDYVLGPLLETRRIVEKQGRLKEDPARQNDALWTMNMGLFFDDPNQLLSHPFSAAAAYLNCFEPGQGTYELDVRATAEYSPGRQRTRVRIKLDWQVTCVAPEPLFKSPSPGIAPPPSPTPTNTPTPPQVACLMNTKLTLDGVDIVPGQYHQGRIRVNVIDQDGRPVADARVSIRTEKSDGTRTTAEGVTNADGYVMFGMRTTQPGTNTLFITNVEQSGCSWEVSNTSLTWEATAPSAPPALGLSCDHRLPGVESDVIVRGENFAPGQGVSGQVGGPGVVSNGQFSATVGADGRFEARVPINRFGTYNVTAASLNSTINVGATCSG